MKENLMSAGQKSTNEKYRIGYDDIEWDREEKKKPSKKEK